MLDIRAHVNVISSHMIYKVKIEDGHLLRLQALIAPYGKEDSAKADLQSACNMCFPVQVRIIFSTAAQGKWRLFKRDVEISFSLDRLRRARCLRHTPT